MASPLFESAARVRDDGVVIIFYSSNAIAQKLASYEWMKYFESMSVMINLIVIPEVRNELSGIHVQSK